MSYDIAAWFPAEKSELSDVAMYAAYMDLLDNQVVSSRPSLRVLRFVSTLERRWKDRPPWAAEPLADDAVGDFVVIPIILGAAEEVVPQVANMGKKMGFVVFDPQLQRRL